MGFRWFF